MKEIFPCAVACLGIAAQLRASDGPPQVLDPPLTQFAWPGRSVSLKVSVTNTTPLLYQWQWNGTNLPSATNKSLSLPSVGLTNIGEYRVILSNTAGVATSAVGRLVIRDWPRPTGPSFYDPTNLEKKLETVLRQHDVPGASLAIMKDGRLILARGYGYMNPEYSAEPVHPDALFRIASLSKAVTAATILKLVDDGRLNLDSAAFPLLHLPMATFAGAQPDSRLTNVTVRQLLNHTAGWNRETARNPAGTIGFDPQDWPERCAHDLGLVGPVTARELVQWTLGFPLQTKPGSVFKYSNNGYLAVGLLIEQLARMPYEEMVKSLLAPHGITRFRFPGSTPALRRSDEAVPWLSPLLNVRALGPVFQLLPSVTADFAYSYPPEFVAGDGGWATSAMDYARFVTLIVGQSTPSDLLTTNAVKTMLIPTAASRVAAQSGDTPYGVAYGMGWSIDESTGEILHGGGLPGATSLAVRRKDGITYVIFCNTLDSNLQLALKGELDSSLAAMRSWPTNDLFEATLSYAAWQSRHFNVAELNQAEISGDDADPDGDGISNLLEYAQNSDPLRPDPQPWLNARVSKDSGEQKFVLEYQARPLGHAVRYQFEASSDLRDWQAFEPHTVVTTGADGMMSINLIDSTFQPGPRSRFYRTVVRRGP